MESTQLTRHSAPIVSNDRKSDRRRSHADRVSSVVHVPEKRSSPHAKIVDQADNWRDQLAVEICEAYEASGHVALESIFVDVLDATIQLFGRSPNYFIKQLAQEIARSQSAHQKMAIENRVTVCRA